MENNGRYWGMNFDKNVGAPKVQFFGVFYVDVVLKIQISILHVQQEEKSQYKYITTTLPSSGKDSKGIMHHFYATTSFAWLVFRCDSTASQ